MLTVLRTVSSFRAEGKLDLSMFKIIYMAPMKALASEVVSKFGKRLMPYGIRVAELTGDMQMTKAEMDATQMIVTTPEKWDVVTRKSTGDGFVSKVRLLIIDEIHLLHEERGSVIESVVARTLRLVETSQSMIRIVGLSATLPNYVDVAEFLRVNLEKGLFFFGAGFRPVPLEQHFIGIKGKAATTVFKSKLNTVCYEKAFELVRQGHQVMIFVHSRKDTVATARALKEEASHAGNLAVFQTENLAENHKLVNEVNRSRNKELVELFQDGFGIHHAGMVRSDRNLTERLFSQGLVKVLCCTATLAWGVNLPAHGVIIKGTNVYNAEKGAMQDLSILDVLQIFGRAGRPQFEDSGTAYILTAHERLQHYITSMTHQFPIESQFSKRLADNLNAEISLGTVSTVPEAVKWLSYTYLYVRMRKNPFNYGLDWDVIVNDNQLVQTRRHMIFKAAEKLQKAQMIVFNERTELLSIKDLGRIASNYYISCNTVEVFNTILQPRMTEADVLFALSMSSEFENIVSRPEEGFELKKLADKSCLCAVKVSCFDVGHPRDQ